jgi:hypothetical protein
VKFLSGARNRSVTYTVIPSRSHTDISTGRSFVTPAVRAVFRENRFDSAAPGARLMYKEYADWKAMSEGAGRTANQEEVDAVQMLVEQYLRQHGDFGRVDGRGLYLDNTDTMRSLEARRQLVRRCMFQQDLGEQTVQCEQQVVDAESDYCEAHKAIVETLVREVGDDIAAGEITQETVAAGAEA